MQNSLPSHRPRRDQGVALVLVLCFVVLVTGLVVAYFSRTLTTRQLSSASTSTTQAEMLANSAADVILGDLKQEIAAGSTPSPVQPDGSTVYFPTAAANAVPQRNAAPAPGAAASPAPVGGPMPNLVRRSLRLDSPGGVNAFPAPAVAPSSRASAANSSTPNPSGRAISPARWNRHYLLPTAAPAGSTASVNASAPVADFTAPDWVFVTAEKGPEVLSNPTTDAGGNVVTVTGRYAYAIYDEGGLLDINYTGFPSASTNSHTGLGHIGSKLPPSYADLAQLDNPSGSNTPPPPWVDNLLGWRNYASLQATSTFPTLQPAASTADSAYSQLFTATASNLLQVPLTMWNGKTDQRFLSRQQLLGYFAATGLNPKYLQYLGTFSRGLNQPSYLPEHLPAGLDPIRPVVRPTDSGGNNAGPHDGLPGNTGIVPNFLLARVTSSFTRNDGTTMAVVGEPLVKKRFALNRLAWLTYKGPSSKRNTAATDGTGPDGDIVRLKQYGVTKEWLDQGNDANIEACFGLRWGPNPTNPGNTAVTNGWTYVHGTSGSNGGAILNIYNPDKPADVARLSPGREPDFFELLKASINPGTLAKASFYFPGASGPSSDPLQRAAQDQYKADYSLDAAILQIGANIIDQFDADGFPTRINYNLNLGVTPGAVYGDENLPYVSRVRSGLIRVVEANPLESLGDLDASLSNTIKDTGVGVLMNYPELWNPHGWSSVNIDGSVGIPAPQSFKIFAQTSGSNVPVEDSAVMGSANVLAWSGNPASQPPGTSVTHHLSCDAYWNTTPSRSPGFNSMYHFSFGFPGLNEGDNYTMRESNTKMTFTISRDPRNGGPTLFREPTILYRPNHPTGSLLASPALMPGNNALGKLASNAGFFGTPGGGLVSAVGSNSPTNPPMKGAAYVGFYVGAHPLRWWDNTATAGGDKPNLAGAQTQFGFSEGLPGRHIYDVTYVLACEDGNGGWSTYDAKSVGTNGSPDGYYNLSTDASFGLSGSAGTTGSIQDNGIRFYQTVDPRTSRFGMLDPYINDNTHSIPPRQNSSAVNIAEGTLKTDREGTSSGTAPNFAPFVGPADQYKTNPDGTNEWFSGNMGWYHSNDVNDFRPGLLSQNNSNGNPDGNINTSLPSGYNSGGTIAPFYYADADGVVRRAAGGNVPNAAATADGLPIADTSAGSQSTIGSGTSLSQIDSRPVILNRPFQSVAELGYVYSGTPWKNLDFFLPESGDAAMLDVFCVNDNSDANALTAGQVNLNTRQAPVLQAILSQTNKNLWNDPLSAPSDSATTILGGSNAQAQQIAQALVSRTVVGPTSGPIANTGPQPLQNVSDLVGRWVKQPPNLNGIAGKAFCDGFTADLAVAAASDPTHNIQRFEEGAVRALANVGQTRVWNLMFDIVAQTGRYAKPATNLDQFNVEGEQHYWVHVAIDRYTGKVLDKQVEIVKE